MNLSERQQTTDSAVRIIQKNLGEEDFTSAVLLAFIYASIRLRTLVADNLSQKTSGEVWRTIHGFLSVPSFLPLLRYAKKHNIVTKDQFMMLDWIREERNGVAHESTVWKTPTPEIKESIEIACHFAMQFLLETAKSRSEPEEDVPTVNAPSEEADVPRS